VKWECEWNDSKHHFSKFSYKENRISPALCNRGEVKSMISTLGSFFTYLA
jgi:hypothetical protein